MQKASQGNLVASADRSPFVVPNISIANLYSADCVRHKERQKIRDILCECLIENRAMTHEMLSTTRSAWRMKRSFLNSWLLTRLLSVPRWKRTARAPQGDLESASSGLIIMFTWIDLDVERYWRRTLDAAIPAHSAMPTIVSDTTHRTSRSFERFNCRSTSETIKVPSNRKSRDRQTKMSLTLTSTTFFLLSHSLLSPCLLVFIAQKRESQFKYSNLLHSLAALFRDDFLAKFHLALPESYVMDDEFVEQCFCSHATFDCQHTAQV